MKSILRFSFIVALVLMGFNAFSQFEIFSTSSTPVDCRPENGEYQNGTITVTLSGGTPPYTITWQHLVLGYSGIINTNSTVYTITGLQAGGHIITANHVDGDPDDPELALRSVGQPSLLTVGITPSPAETCPDTELQLNGNPNGGNAGGYTHLWSGNATTHFLDPLTIVDPRFQTSTPNTYVLTYTAQDSKGCTATETVDLDVYEQPTANAGSSDEACGFEYTLNATPSVGNGVWTFSGPGGALFDDNTNPNTLVTVDAYGDYTFTWTETNVICIDADDVVIGFFMPATVDAGGPYEVCSGSSVQLNGSFGGSATSAEWIGGLGTFNPNRNTLNAFYTPHATEAATTVNLLLRTDDPPGICEAVEDATSITVYQQPTANAGPTGNSCSLEFTLAAVPSAGTGTWTQFSGPGIAGFASPNSPTSGVTVDQYGTYVFTWTEENGICTSDDNVTVNFYQQPVADAGPDDSTCGLTISLAAVPSVGIGEWTVTSGTGNANFVDPNLATTSVTVDAYGTYVFRWTEVNGTCDSFDEVTINFFEQPLANAGPDGNSCSLEYNLAAVASVGTGTWTFSGPGTATFDIENDPNTRVEVTAYGTYIFTWTEVNGICSSSDDVTVNFYQQPIADAGSDDANCGLTYTLGATSSVGTGTWTLFSGPGAANFTNANSPTSDVTVTLYGQYVFHWTEINGSCSSFDDVIIDFFQQPISNAGPDDETCGLSIALAAVPSAGVGTWTRDSGPGSANFSDTNDPNANVTVTAYGTHIFRWTEVDGICSDSDIVTIDFYQQPVANAGPDNQACGLSISLGAIPSVGTGTWTLDSGPGAANFTDPNSPTSSVTVTVYGTYIFTWTEVNGTCPPSADNVTINFFEEPNADAGPDNATCGQTISLAAVPSVGTGVWSRTSGPGNATFVNPNLATTSVSVDAYGEYVFRWTEINGICDDFDEVTINFYQQPIANAGPDGNSCSLNYNLAAVASVGTGTWTQAAGPGTAIFANSNSPTSSVSVDLYGSYTFTWTEVNGICTHDDDVTVNFYEQPIANAGPDDATCGLTISLAAIPSVGIGEWTVTSGAGNANFVNPNLAPTSVTVDAYGTYVFRWTEVNGTCDSFDEVTIDFFEQPIADAGAGGSTCGQTFNLNAIPSVGLGTWTFTGPANASFSPNANTPNATVTVDDYGDYTFTWTEVNGICTSDDDVLVSFFEQPISDAGPDQEVCGLAATLAAIPSVGTGTWTQEVGPGTATFTNLNDPFTDVSVDIYGAYVFRWTEVNNICNHFDEVTITFWETPTADAGADDDACGFVYNLNATPSVGTGTWTYAGPGTAIFNNANAPNATATVDILGVYTFTWTETNGVCSDADNVDINFYQISISVAITDAICYGEDNGTITVTATGGVEPYLYSIDGDFGPFVPGNVFVVGEGNYEIWVLDDNGCLAEYPGNSIYVGEPDEIFVGFNEILPVSGCFGNTNGVIDIKPNPLPYDLYHYTLVEFPNESDWVDNHRFEGLAAGIYYPKVRDKATGCIVEYSGITITLTQPAQIDFSIINIVHVTGCWYNTNGSFRATTPTGGQGVKQVSIDGISWFSFPRTFSGRGVDTYTVYARDENGCIVTKQVEITGPPPIEIASLSQVDNICFGDSNGEIDVTATGGTGALSYSLLLEGAPYAGSQPTGLFTGLAAGNYTIRITDDNSCILDEDVIITSPEELIIETEITNITCNYSGNVGVIRARGTGGTELYTITLFLVGVEQANFTDISEDEWVEFTGLGNATDYEVIIRDANFPACVEVNSGFLTVTVPDELLIDPLSIVTVDLTCNGVPEGTITIAGQGGTLPYTYVLYDDVTNQVGDAIVANNTDPIQFTGLAAGTYTVEIDDANGCGPVASAPITIIEPDAIEIDPGLVTITHITCFGDNDGEVSVTASGGTGDLYYTLTQGGVPVAGFLPQTNNGTFGPLEPGTYVIEITDDNGCGPILSDELTVDEPDALEISTNITDALCFGENGSFQALASNGTAPYLYILETDLGVLVDSKNGDVDEWIEFENLAPGNYVLSVSDANLCENSIPIVIAEPNLVEVSITSFSHPTCDAEGNSTPGIIIAEATGGSGTYTYTIYRNGIYQAENETGIFDALSSGDYYVEAVDENACGPAVTATQTLDSPTDIEIDVINITHILCNGALTGEIEVLVINAVGTPLYTITPGDDDWQTDNTFTNLAAGDYTVRIKDDNNCVISQMVTINEPLALVLSIVTAPPTTAIDTDGSIQVDVSGGTPNYWYELFKWDDVASDWISVDNVDNTAATTHTFTGLGVGLYRVVVTDSNSCSTFEDVSLSQFNISLAATDASCFESCNGTITVTPAGGAIQTIIWEKDGVDFTAEMLANYDAVNDVYTNLCAGIYAAFATDTEGNDATASIEVMQPTAIDVDYTIVTPDCYTNLPVGIVNFDITGGTPFADGYDITWAGGSVRGFIVDELAAGTYNFVISDENGCEFIVEEIEIVYPEGMTLTSLEAYDLFCYENNTGNISVLVSGGTEPITYQIVGPSGTFENNNGIFTGLAAGEYEINITDSNGCPHVFEGDNTIEIDQPTEIQITQITVLTDPLECHYDVAGLIEMEVTGGTPDYTYEWSNGLETLNLENPSPGNYTITVTDQNGCERSRVINIPGPDPLSASYTISTAKCRLAPEGNTGQISIYDLNGGNGVFSNDFTVKWYLEGLGDLERDNFWTVDQLQSGDYTAIIRDLKQCRDTLEFNVPFDEANGFVVGINMDDNYCYFDNASLTAVALQGNFGPSALFEWYNVTENPNLIIASTNPYNTPPLTQTQRMLVRVISSEGCLEQRERTINVYPQIGPFLDRNAHSFFSPSDLVTFGGDETVISVLADTEYGVEVLTTNPDYTLSYNWTPAQFFFPPNAKNSTIIFQSGTYESFFTGQIFNTITQKNEQYIPLVAQVQSEFGCIETINLKARILDRVRIANVFSPNGDGINDIWMVPYADLFPDLEVRIYNRWGAMVWSAKGTEATKGWKGTNSNGKDLPVGTYYYVISFNVKGSSKWKPISGSVTIIR